MHAIRTYTVNGPLASVPALAQKYDLNIALGGWIDSGLENNLIEVENVINSADKTVVIVFAY